MPTALVSAQMSAIWMEGRRKEWEGKGGGSREGEVEKKMHRREIARGTSMRSKRRYCLRGSVVCFPYYERLSEPMTGRGERYSTDPQLHGVMGPSD